MGQACGCGEKSPSKHVIDPPVAIPPPVSFRQRYKLGKLLGRGAFGLVHLCTSRESEEVFAVKIIDISELKRVLGDYGLNSLEKEVEAMRKLDHPHVVKLYDTYKESGYYYMVMEYLPGGELLTRMIEKDNFYSEVEARDIMKILIETIKYCHDNNFVHRDLKPENLLLISETDDVNFKIVDFGFATQESSEVENRCVMQTNVGTLPYQAPEILSRLPYDRACDMWSLGVICFLLLRGKFPFQDENDLRMQHKILNVEYEFDSEWASISPFAKDLVKKLLVANPKTRLTADAALKHPWFKDESIENPRCSLEDMKSQSPNSWRFSARLKFQEASFRGHVKDEKKALEPILSSVGKEDETGEVEETG